METSETVRFAEKSLFAFEATRNIVLTNAGKKGTDKIVGTQERVKQKPV